jgi:tetratricopeptide (TPR) repeat protein
MPARPGTAEALVEQEQLTGQFAGDLAAFDRLEALADAFTHARPDPGRAALIGAQVACSTHRFANARAALEQAQHCGVAASDTDRLALAIDQATGDNLQAVLATRRERAAKPSTWTELQPLGALLADLGEFDEAESTNLRELREYPGVSPFALAWACFQLGMLWGVCIPSPDRQRASQWYRSAIDYLPCYVKARVHLAEIYLDHGDAVAAQMLLEPARARADPDASPFALAWPRFQLGLLWGDSRPPPDRQRDSQWYRSAIHYLPCYV